MIRAALDIGTNSTRLLIVDRRKDESKILFQQAIVTRIGEGQGEHRIIKKIPLERTILALKEYKRIMQEKRVAEFKIVATSAMRDASNKAEVLDKIHDETGMYVEIISGEEEARLSYLGASADFEGDNRAIDIGGGSTEITFYKGGEVNFKSVDLGAVRLKEFPELRNKIKETFDVLELSDGTVGLIGVGGTITTLAAIDLRAKEYDWEKIHGHVLSLERIREIEDELVSMDLESRKKVDGLQPERADIIIYGIRILIEFMDITGTEEIIVSDKDLLFALAG